MSKVNADRQQEWLEFEISLGEGIGKLLDDDEPEGMAERIGSFVDEKRAEIHRHLAERIDLALSDEVARLVEGDPKKGVRQLDERYFRIRLQLDALLTSAGLDGRPMRRSELMEDLFGRGEFQPRVSSDAVGTGSSTPNDGRPNPANPNRQGAKAAASSRSNKMNPNNSSFRSTRSGDR
ncbi:MAG: hypothetical protein HQ477_07185 [Chloroflexi bacterium]|nr:hypothetical protein [Chloroflexota bacterium]